MSIFLFEDEYDRFYLKVHVRNNFPDVRTKYIGRWRVWELYEQTRGYHRDIERSGSDSSLVPLPVI